MQLTTTGRVSGRPKLALAKLKHDQRLQAVDALIYAQLRLLTRSTAASNFTQVA